MDFKQRKQTTIYRYTMNRKVDLSKYNNSNYQPGLKIKRVLWYFANLIFISNSFLTSYKLKVWILKRFGAKIGRGVKIKPSVSIKYPWFLEIGNNVWIGEKVWIDNLGTVKIHDNVCISQGAMILSGNHNFKNEAFELIVESIEVEEGSWIGAKSIVCSGVRIKSHAVLTVGSVASKDLESYSIYKGNPCLKIRDRQIL